MASVSKTFNELVAFTRSTSATYVNSAGYITTTPVANYITYSNQSELWTKFNAFVQTNLLLWSEDFTNAVWVVPSGTIGPVVANSTVSPDGTLTADTVSATSVNATFWQTYSPTAGTVYTGSIWLKRKTGTGVVSVTADGSTFTTVDLSSGGWVRGTQSYTAAIGTKAVGIRIATSGDEVYVWGAQLVLGAVPGDYRATTTAALPCLYADYSGQLRARKICEDTSASSLHYVASIGTFNAPAGQPYTFSVKVKTGEQKQIGLELNSGIFVSFNTTTGTVVSTNTYSGGVIVNTAITSLGSGWYLCSVAGYNPSAVTTAAYLEVGGTNYTGNGTNGMYIADAQLVPGTVPGPYYDTSATLTYAQRRDFSPDTLACLGLLVEEQRTNLLLQSSDFTNNYWGKSNCTVSAGSVIAPDGTSTANLLTATTTAFTFLNVQSGAVAGTTGTNNTLTFWFRAGTVNTLTVGLYDPVGANWGTGYAAILSGPGTITTLSGSLSSLTGLSTTQWTRVAVTRTNAVATGILPFVYPRNQVSSNAGDSVYLWGAQLEAGTSATSYIPTVTTQVTRAADIANVNVLSPWFNQPGGTLYVEADTSEPSSLSVKNAAVINDGTSSNMHRVLSYTGKIGGNTVLAGVAVADLQPYTYTVNTPFKFAFAYATNDFAAVGNGGAPSTDPLGALPTGLITMGIGNVTGVFWNGHIRRITYYPQRLTNAQLQSITT